jgi:hypothetical protein
MEINNLLLNEDQTSYSQFTKILTHRTGVKPKIYYKSLRHEGESISNDYYKPISLIIKKANVKIL